MVTHAKGGPTYEEAQAGGIRTNKELEIVGGLLCLMVRLS